ncbi:msl1803 [Mesorhizobium japonicum MAFF 303099]|uniref:Msl1803 protein n=1 Tax=Mesorhizobium japonicum (strain LMG 29417 / CECT 9101 / MAFF 303099) TaxID=266835 RepID=Q98JS8_RHILO|nr:msl1803 [Mesorhizobium japonicum MAFF 303099]
MPSPPFSRGKHPADHNPSNGKIPTAAGAAHRRRQNLMYSEGFRSGGKNEPALMSAEHVSVFAIEFDDRQHAP